jgi:hypothetical protein
MLLSVHWGVAWAVTAMLLTAVWVDLGRVRACGRVFLLLLAAHLGLSSAASRWLPLGGDQWSWALVFATGLCLISGWLGPLSVRAAAALGAVALTAFYTALPPRAARAAEAALMLALAIGVVGPNHSGSPPHWPTTSLTQSLSQLISLFLFSEFFSLEIFRIFSILPPPLSLRPSLTPSFLLS